MNKFDRQIERILAKKRRDDYIYALRKSGMTLEQIAERVSLTRQRVQQILAEINQADEKMGVKDA